MELNQYEEKMKSHLLIWKKNMVQFVPDVQIQEFWIVFR